MNAGNRTSRLKHLVQLGKRRGIWEAALGLTWVIKTSVTKSYIRVQDRLGWYSYQDWVSQNERVSQASLPAQVNDLFSFLIPYTAGGSSLCMDTLASLKAQSYPNWEICLIYESRHAVEIASIKKDVPDSEPRIRWLQHDPVVSSMKSGMASLKGQWIGILGCGDTLSPHALASFAECILQSPGADIIYSDEDELSENGKTRLNPFFKPDWSPELLLSINYLSHAIFSRDIFDRMTGSEENYKAAIYRCADLAHYPVHISKVLLHIRRGKINPWISAEPDQHRGAPYVRGEARQPAEDRLISMIILTRDKVNYLQQCINSILDITRYRNFEIVLVENGSQEGQTFEYYDHLRQAPGIRVVEYFEQFNYSRANNFGVQHAHGDVLLFLNNDVQVIDPDWLEELYRWCCVSAIGAVGGKLLYPDNTIQHAGIVVGMEGHASHIFGGVQDGSSGIFGSTDWYRNYLAVTGACMAMRRDVFEEVGGFDENYQLIFSDVEICLRIGETGYRVVYTPNARLIHHEGRTRSRYIPHQDIQRAAERLHQIVSQGDPFYNPNLSYAVRAPTFKRAFEEPPDLRLDNILRYF